MKHKDLIKAWAEGALIECKQHDGTYIVIKGNIDWFCPDCEYRIKDNISIDSWNEHKETIKLWWDGDDVQVEDIDGWWATFHNSPKWEKHKKYRVT